jgi:hypothetical protein
MRSLYHIKRTDRKPQTFHSWKAMYLVCYYCHSRIVKIQPGWNLPIGDDENIPNPWCMPLNRSQRVSQLFIVFKTAGRNVFILLGLGETWTHKDVSIFKSSFLQLVFPFYPLWSQGALADFQRCSPNLSITKNAKDSDVKKNPQKYSISLS